MLDRDGAAAGCRILYISRSMIRSALHRVQGAARELLERGRLLADRAAAAAPRRRRVDAGDAEADAAAARRRGAVAFDLALPAREARLAEELRLGFAHDSVTAPLIVSLSKLRECILEVAMTNQCFGCLAMHSCFPQCRDFGLRNNGNDEVARRQSRLLFSRRRASVASGL